MVPRQFMSPILVSISINLWKYLHRYSQPVNHDYWKKRTFDVITIIKRSVWIMLERFVERERNKFWNSLFWFYRREERRLVVFLYRKGREIDLLEKNYNGFFPKRVDCTRTASRTECQTTKGVLDRESEKSRSSTDRFNSPPILHTHTHTSVQ